MNEVKIIVRSHNDTSAGFQSARTDVTRWADESAKAYTERFALNMQQFGRRTAAVFTGQGKEIGSNLGDSTGQSFTQKFTTLITQAAQKSKATFTKLGQSAGDEIGRAAGEEIIRHITRSMTESGGRGRDERDRFTSSSSSRSGGGGGDTRVINRSSSSSSGGGSSDRDVDRVGRSWVAKMLGWGKEAAGNFWSGFSGALGSLFGGGGDFTMLVKAGLVGALITAAAAAGPAVGASITAAIGLALGGGAIAAGVVAAFRDPTIQAAAKELGGKVTKLFEEFGKPFRGPVADFLEKVTTSLLPQVSKYAKEIADVFAPLADDLGDGIIGMLQNMLPGLTEGMKGLAPIVKVLADRLPDIGQAMGDFFRKIGEQGPEAALFFNDLITVIIKVIGWLGTLIAWLTSMYSNFRNNVKLIKKIWDELPEAIAGGVRRILDRFKGVIAAGYALYVGFRVTVNRIRAAVYSMIDFFSTLRARVSAVFASINGAALRGFGWVNRVWGFLSRAIGSFSSFASRIRGILNGIPGVKTITIRGFNAVGQAVAGAMRDIGRIASGYAHGGIKGAASGMMGGGLSWVGERGPELVNLPTGSTVRSSGDSMRMMRDGLRAAGGGGGEMRVSVDSGQERTLIGVLVRSLRLHIGDNYGGSVQAALGRVA